MLNNLIIYKQRIIIKIKLNDPLQTTSVECTFYYNDSNRCIFHDQKVKVPHKHHPNIYYLKDQLFLH